MDTTRPSPRTLLGAPLSTVCWFLQFLVVLDCWMTVRLISAERGRELNPFVDWILQHHGIQAFVLAKLLLSALCLLWIVHRAPAHEGRLAAMAGLLIYLPLAGLHVLTSQSVLLPLF